MRIEDKLSEQTMKEDIKRRDDLSDRLIETWAKKEHIVGKDFVNRAHNNLKKYRNLAIVLEQSDKFLSRLNETVISNNFGMLPQNVMRTISLGYGKSIRGDIFSEWAMQTMKDSIWYIKPVYASTLRDGVEDTITHQTATNRFSSEIEIESVGTGDGSTANYPGTTAKNRVRPYKVFVIVDDVLVAIDDGTGVFEDIVSGTLSTGVASTISYDTGAYNITFADIPGAAETIQIRYNVDTEQSTNYDELGALELSLNEYIFRPDVHPLEVSFSKKAQLQLQTTLDVGVEDSLVVAAAEELKKSLDFRALREGYRLAKSNSIITYNADWKAAGASSLKQHIETVPYIFDKAEDAIYSDLQRGGVSAVYGGASAISYLKQHSQFKRENSGKKVGGYKVGELDGIPVFKVPSSIVPDDELVTSWVNPEAPGDAAISIGVMLPMASTDKLFFKNLQTEYALFSYEDIQSLQPKYCRRIKMSNLSTVLS